MSAYEAMVSAAGSSSHAERIRGLRKKFEERTGAFGPDDAWFEVRSRAFWDDALTSADFAPVVEAEIPEGARPWLGPLRSSHRGLFQSEPGSGRTLHLSDQWSGAEFVVDEPTEPGLDEALRAARRGAALFDGRVVARANPAFSVALLPGALFHPADATEPILRILDSSRERGTSTHALLDMLLRMERNLRSHSRVKASYAYRI